jgi:hypothetical protein
LLQWLGPQAAVVKVRPLAAVVLVVVVEPELPAIVAAADQVPLAPGVAVVEPAVAGTVAVSLSLVAGVLRGAAPPALVVTAGTALARGGLDGESSWILGLGLF